MTWTIRKKMLAGFLTESFLTLVLCAVAVYQIGVMRDTTLEIGETVLPKVELVGQLNESFSDFRAFHIMHIDALAESDMMRFEQEIEAVRKSIEGHTREYEDRISSKEERILFDAFIVAYRGYTSEVERTLAKSRKNDNDEARKEFFGVVAQRYAQAEVTLTGLTDFNQRYGISTVQAAISSYVQARLILLTATGLVVGLSVVLALWLSGSIASPVTRLAEIFRKIAAGDSAGAAAELKLMSTGVDSSNQKDEVGSLVASARDMEGFRASIVESLRDGVSKLASSMEQIGVTAKEYAETSTAQASAVTEVSTTMEEVKQTSEVAAAGAREVAQAADEAAKRGMSSRDRLNDAVGVMQAIYQRVSGIAEQILKLSDQTSQIGTIVDVVSDLAEQSNLLAVNASIEAAKAGEQGRGFSVVASEVRNLADQSKRATQQIRGILAQIQKATQSAVMATEEGAKRSEDGRHAIEAVREVMENLAMVLEESSTRSRQIAGASAQQASGVAQIASALASISRAARDNASGVRQLETAVGDLEHLAADLRAKSEGF